MLDYLFACWVFFMLLLRPADFLNLFFPKDSFREHFEGVKWFGSRSGEMFSGILSVWVQTQTVCKGYQHMTKVAASKERVCSIASFLIQSDAVLRLWLIFPSLDFSK